MSNLVEILVTAKNLTGPTMAAVNAEVNKTSKGMALLNKTALLAGAGFAAAGVEAVRMAGKFDSNMALLQTQAGVSADKIDGLKKGVLDLAGKVGQSPDSLAASLFHVESNFESMGISSKKALDLVGIAAKGAAVGHADLVDVTNALTAAVAANIPGVQNLDQAMGALNATVGAGDMSMSDLAKAFGGGNIAAVKGFGLSITDVGAALATFGDANMRGASAGTALRMSVQALAHPVATAGDTLKKLGLQSDTLAKDMQKGGLKLAVEDLVAHMQAAGITSAQTGAVITDAFGKKAGTGLNILVNSFDKLESKYPALAAGASDFGKSWADTQKTFAQQVKELEAGFDALMISVGEKLIPPVQSFVHVLAEHKTAVRDSVIALAGLAAATLAVATAMKVASGAKLVWTGLTAGAVAARGAMETFALKAMYMRDASVAAGGGLKGLGAAFGTLSTGAKLGLTVAAIGGLVLLLDKLSSSGKRAPDVDRMATALGNLGRTGKVSGELAADFGKNLDGLGYAVDRLSGKASGMDKFNDVMNKVFTLGMGQSNSMKEAKRDVDAVDKGLAQLVSGGHAEQAQAALTKLASAGVKIPSDKLDDYQAALASVALESSLTAAAQGRFGQQAQAVQAQLKAQQDVADGLRQSLQALDQVNQDAYNSETKFYDTLSALSTSLKDNGRTLDVHTEKGRNNRDAMSALAAATDDWTGKLAAQNASMTKIDAVYNRGYDNLVKYAEGMGKNADQARKLADGLLQVPKEIKLQADISGWEAKLTKAKQDVKSATGPRKAKIEGDISQLEAKIRKAKAEIAGVVGKTVTMTLKVGTAGMPADVKNMFGFASGGHVVGPGSGTSDSVPIWASNGEFVVNAQAAKRNRRLLEAINSGQMQGFASGGSVSASERQARNSAVGELSLSYFGSRVYSRNEFQSSTASPGSLGDLVGTLNQWRATIKAALHGAQESKLLRAFDAFGKAALKNEKALAAVNSKLDAAKDKLSSLKDSFNELKSSVAESVVSFGSIAKPGGSGPLGSISAVAQLSQSVGQAKEFAQALEQLRKKGLNGQSLSELAQAGIDNGGLENAERLLSASPSDIKTINDLEKQLQAAGAAAGTTAGTGLYGTQIDAAQALVKGLEKQQSKLNKIMEQAADAMAKRLKAAFGAKASGGVVGAAATGGAHWGRTLVGEYGPEIADLPIGTRVHSAPDTARMLAGGGGSDRPIEITLILGGQQLGRVLIDPLRGEIKNRGGSVQAVLGQRGKG